MPRGRGTTVPKLETVTRVSDELILPTFAVRLLDRLIVWVGRPGVHITDVDWNRYIEWIQALLLKAPELSVLVTSGTPPPTSAQRSLFNREIKFESVRIAVLISDPKLVAVVRVMSWFMKSAEPFRSHELQKALAHLGESDVARVRTTIRELGGVLSKAAP